MKLNPATITNIYEFKSIRPIKTITNPQAYLTALDNSILSIVYRVMLFCGLIILFFLIFNL